MLGMNKQNTTWVSGLFRNTPDSIHKREETLTPARQKIIDVTGTDPAAEAGDSTLREIANKLQSGIELSPSELEYLRANAPDLYEEAIKMIALRKRIEQRLEQCKSKEQVAQAQSEISNQIAMECDVGASKKCDLNQALMYQRRINTANNCFVKFAKTDTYKNLPDTDGEYVRLKAESRSEVFGDSVSISEEGKKKAEKLGADKEIAEASDKSDSKTDKTDIEKTEDDKKLSAADRKDLQKNRKKADVEISAASKLYSQGESSFVSVFNISV